MEERIRELEEENEKLKGILEHLQDRLQQNEETRLFLNGKIAGMTEVINKVFAGNFSLSHFKETTEE